MFCVCGTPARQLTTLQRQNGQVREQVAVSSGPFTTTNRSIIRPKRGRRNVLLVPMPWLSEGKTKAAVLDLCHGAPSFFPKHWVMRSGSVKHKPTMPHACVTLLPLLVESVSGRIYQASWATHKRYKDLTKCLCRSYRLEIWLLRCTPVPLSLPSSSAL